MPEEPEQKVKDAQGKGRQATRRGKVKEYFRDNPTLVLTLIYADLTGIGILYSWIFYGQFGINILDFAEIGDFLLAAFKAPAVTFSALLVQVLLVVVPLFILRFVASRVGHAIIDDLADDVAAEVPRTVLLSLTVSVAAGSLLILTAIIPMQLARSKAAAIQQGEQPQVTVQYRQFSNTTEQVTEPGLELIGATQKVVFFYDSEDQRTLVVPQAQIVSVEVPDSEK